MLEAKKYIRKLVGKKDVITGAPQEREFSLAANHADLIKLQQENGDPDELLSEWMRSLFSSNSHDAVDRRLKSRAFPPHDVAIHLCLPSFRPCDK